MKQLQNNFTTPEQSKRLLELGVPADSADMHMSYSSHDSYSAPQWNDVRVTAYQSYFPTLDIIPCWSVGRLIEIMRICQKDELGYLSINIKMLKEKSLVERCIFDLEKTERFDFSKLEDEQ